LHTNPEGGRAMAKDDTTGDEEVVDAELLDHGPDRSSGSLPAPVPQPRYLVNRHTVLGPGNCRPPARTNRPDRGRLPGQRGDRCPAGADRRRQHPGQARRHYQAPRALVGRAGPSGPAVHQRDLPGVRRAPDAKGVRGPYSCGVPMEGSSGLSVWRGCVCS
jgi:hypothetical protein